MKTVKEKKEKEKSIIHSSAGLVSCQPSLVNLWFLRSKIIFHNPYANQDFLLSRRKLLDATPSSFKF